MVRLQQIVILLALAFLGGCNHHEARSAFLPGSPTFSTSTLDVYLPARHSVSERRHASWAAAEHLRTYQRMSFVTQPLHARDRRRIYVHAGRVSRSSCESSGLGFTSFVTKDVHVWAGDCWTLPGLSHQLVHSYHIRDCSHASPWWILWHRDARATNNTLEAIFRNLGWCP